MTAGTKPDPATVARTDYHSFEQAGEHYLFFTRSGKLYRISRIAFRLIEEFFPADEAGSLPSPGSPLPRSLSSEQEQLYAELLDILRRELEVPLPVPCLQPQAPGSNSYQNFSIYLAQSCNLACCYCWNRGGSFDKPVHLMGWNAAQRTTRLILSLVERSNAERIFINFYGGEPLLDFPVLRQITHELLKHEARLGKDFQLTIDTNATLLEGNAARFLARYFTQVWVSLDGRQHIHDLQRPTKFGEQTWQKIVDNIRTFPNPKLLGLRATLTAFSDSYLETFRHLTTLGIGRIQVEYCHEPGYHQNPGYGKLIVPPERQLAEMREFAQYYVDYISRYRDPRDIPFLSNLLDSIARFRRGSRFTRPCGAGTNTLAINSHGEVFPCIAFVERNEFAMGQAGTGQLTLHQALADFLVERQFPCHTCWLRYDCAGGCHATHYDMTGNLRSPHPQYCRSMKGRAEVYFHALARILTLCPWHLNSAAPLP